MKKKLNQLNYPMNNNIFCCFFLVVVHYFYLYNCTRKTSISNEMKLNNCLVIWFIRSWIMFFLGGFIENIVKRDNNKTARKGQRSMVSPCIINILRERRTFVIWIVVVAFSRCAWTQRSMSDRRHLAKGGLEVFERQSDSGKRKKGKNDYKECSTVRILYRDLR